MRHDKGFTLVELLVALAIASFLLAGVYTLLIRQQRSYETQDQVVELQQNLRSAITLMRYDMRMIGYGLTEGILPIVVASNNRVIADGTDAITFNANLDAATVILSSGEQMSYTLQAGVPITLPVAAVDGFSLATPYRVELIDLGTGTLITAANLTVVSASNLTLSVQPQQSGILWAGSYIGLPFQTVSYSIDTSGSISLLVRDSGSGPETVAEGIEDFQLSYGFDGINGHPQDGRLTEKGDAANDDEWVYNTSGDSWSSDLSRLRMIRASLLFRTVNPDPDFSDSATGNLEDHTWVEEKKGYRRRLIVFSENIRNLSL